MTFASASLSSGLQDAAYTHLGDASREGSRAYVYRDSLGVPTTSTGVALLVKNGAGKWTTSFDEFYSILGAIGLAPHKITDVTDKLNEIATDLNKTPPTISLALPNGVTEKFADGTQVDPVNAWQGIWMDPVQTRAVYDVVYAQKEVLLASKLGADWAALKDTQAGLGLLELAWTAETSIGPALAAAVAAGDRAAVAYEVLFLSNPTGVVARQDRLLGIAQTIGLFEGAQPTEAELANVQGYFSNPQRMMFALARLGQVYGENDAATLAGRFLSSLENLGAGAAGVTIPASLRTEAGVLKMDVTGLSGGILGQFANAKYGDLLGVDGWRLEVVVPPHNGQKVTPTIREIFSFTDGEGIQHELVCTRTATGCKDGYTERPVGERHGMLYQEDGTALASVEFGAGYEKYSYLGEERWKTVYDDGLTVDETPARIAVTLADGETEVAFLKGTDTILDVTLGDLTTTIQLADAGAAVVSDAFDPMVAQARVSQVLSLAAEGSLVIEVDLATGRVRARYGDGPLAVAEIPAGCQVEMLTGGVWRYQDHGATATVYPPDANDLASIRTVWNHADGTSETRLWDDTGASYDSAGTKTADLTFDSISKTYAYVNSEGVPTGETRQVFTDGTTIADTGAGERVTTYPASSDPTLAVEVREHYQTTADGTKEWVYSEVTHGDGTTDLVGEDGARITGIQEIEGGRVLTFEDGRTMTVHDVNPALLRVEESPDGSHGTWYVNGNRLLDGGGGSGTLYGAGGAILAEVTFGNGWTRYADPIDGSATTLYADGTVTRETGGEVAVVDLDGAEISWDRDGDVVYSWADGTVAAVDSASASVTITHSDGMVETVDLGDFDPGTTSYDSGVGWDSGDDWSDPVFDHVAETGGDEGWITEPPTYEPPEAWQITYGSQGEVDTSSQGASSSSSDDENRYWSEAEALTRINFAQSQSAQEIWMAKYGGYSPFALDWYNMKAYASPAGFISYMIATTARNVNASSPLVAGAGYFCGSVCVGRKAEKKFNSLV